MRVKNRTDYMYIKKHYLELKLGTFKPWNKKKQHFQDQILFIDRVKRFGHIGLFAHCIEDLTFYI